MSSLSVRCQRLQYADTPPTHRTDDDTTSFNLSSTHLTPPKRTTKNCHHLPQDLNLGCPQDRAREDHYGSFLADPPDWPLCCAIVAAAAKDPALVIPVTVKIRLQPTLAATVAFATLLAQSGASLVTVHGRFRGKEAARRDGAADLGWVKAVVDALAPLGVPVVTNGNVRCAGDVAANLAFTGAAGIMVTGGKASHTPSELAAV